MTDVYVYTCFNRTLRYAAADIREATLQFHNDILVYGGAVKCVIGMYRFNITPWENRYIIESINRVGVRDIVCVRCDDVSGRLDGIDLFPEIGSECHIQISDTNEVEIIRGIIHYSYNDYIKELNDVWCNVM